MRHALYMFHPWFRLAIEKHRFLPLMRPASTAGTIATVLWIAGICVSVLITLFGERLPTGIVNWQAGLFSLGLLLFVLLPLAKALLLEIPPSVLRQHPRAWYLRDNWAGQNIRFTIPITHAARLITVLYALGCTVIFLEFFYYPLPDPSGALFMTEVAWLIAIPAVANLLALSLPTENFNDRSLRPVRPFLTKMLLSLVALVAILLTAVIVWPDKTLERFGVCEEDIGATSCSWFFLESSAGYCMTPDISLFGIPIRRSQILEGCGPGNMP